MGRKVLLFAVVGALLALIGAHRRNLALEGAIVRLNDDVRGLRSLVDSKDETIIGLMEVKGDTTHAGRKTSR